MARDCERARACRAGRGFSRRAADRARAATDTASDSPVEPPRYQGGGVFIIIGCLNAGNNDPNLGAAIDSFKIGAQGTNC